MTRLLTRLLAALALAAAAAVGAGSSAAAAPCWKTLINDWYDGRIDRVYPVKCYRDALKHLPEDVQAYSSAREDITRALAARIQGKGNGPQAPRGGAPGKKGGTGAPLPSGFMGIGGPGAGLGPSASGTVGLPGRDGGGGGPVADAFERIGPKDADSIPIPLIVLASIALLLVLAGMAGFVARRIQARRVQLHAARGSQPARKS